jgi:hypothetical protein
MRKRVLVMSDMHCGHNIGLTPPAWQYKHTSGGSTKRNKWGKTQRELWNAYKKLLRSVAPYDVLLFLGDAIDGKGLRSGGVENVTSSIAEQCDMAAYALNYTRTHARNNKYKIFGVYGTDYHVAVDGEDAEDNVARQAGFEKLAGHDWIDVNGCVFDIKHKVGSSGIPHGRHTAMAKEYLWAKEWAMSGQAPKPDVVLRGHVHYSNFAGGPDWLAATCPALQGMGSRYGVRQCSGLVDWGIMTFDVENDGSWDFNIHTVKLDSHKTEAEIA